MNSTGKNHVCPIDKRRFATKAALAQHRNMVHAPKAAPKVVAQRRGGGRRRNARSRASACAGSGLDTLDVSTQLSTTSKAGDLLLKIDLCPKYLVDTRFALEAKLWARWRPVELELTIMTSAGSMTSGAYVAGFTNDVTVSLKNSSVTNISIVSAYVPSVLNRIHTAATLKIPCDTTQKWYLTEGKDDADSSHGTVFVVLASPIGNITADSKVNLMARLRWKVHFDGPIITAQSGEVAQTIYADAGWEGYHTTSNSNWIDGKYLGLKAHAGGEFCEFSQAVPGVVYQLDQQAKLTYVKAADGSKGAVRYGVLIANRPSKNLAVFADLAKAELYASSGDATHCLSYYGAGDPVSPDNPAWTQTTSVTQLRAPDPIMQRILALEAMLRRLNPDLSASESEAERMDFQVLLPPHPDS